MGISSIGGASSAGGASAQGFSLVVDDVSNDTYVLDSVYPAGAYAITLSGSTTNYDIYAIAKNGSYAGYTNATGINISADFDKVVVIGAAIGDQLFFEFRGATSTPVSTGLTTGAGAYVTGVNPAAMPNLNDTTTISGGNFSAQVEVYFVGQNAVEIPAKSIVRSSSTELLVTRPDSFDAAQAPYTVKVKNTGVPLPTATNTHLLTNGMGAGTVPTWAAATGFAFNITNPTQYAVAATDTEGDVTYSIASGTLPAGLTLNASTGMVSGSFSGSAVDGDTVSVTIRATDNGGNYVDRAFTLTANAAPEWVTPSTLNATPPGIAFSQQISATGSPRATVLTYSLVAGALPAGLSLATNGTISGTSTEASGTVSTYTIRVTDEHGAYSEREFNSTSAMVIELLLAGGGGGGGSRDGNGGGAGGVLYGTQQIVLGTSYSVAIGGGGSGGPTGSSNSSGPGGAGGNSSFNGAIAYGGGRGSNGSDLDTSGGSVGGVIQGRLTYPQVATQTSQNGLTGYGNEIEGTNNGTNQNFCGGGGAGQIGYRKGGVLGTGKGGDGITLMGVTLAGGGGYSGGGNYSSWPIGPGGAGGGGTGAYYTTAGGSGAANTGSGGGGAGYNGNTCPAGGSGGSGVCYIKYPDILNITYSGITVASTTTANGYKTSKITAGSGTISWS